ncbi:MAG: cobalt-precorrin-5B (C(1))-methyltransferase CbiD, partial [Thermosynechococcaceae cyanobacterium]
MPDPRSGYTLPVFACAAAIASLRYLYDPQPYPVVTLDLINPPEPVDIPIEQVSSIRPGMALAITRSDPGDNLDLTRNTPIWAVVEWADATQTEAVILKGGEGIGIDQNREGQAAFYAYAQRLFKTNLERELRGGDRIQVTIILPEGRALAERTSNAAFGVVDGLSLLGTSGISQPLTAPGQLEVFQTQLQQKAEKTDSLVFCLGENGLDIARSMGIPEHCLIKTANWLGPMLVAAGEQGLKSILLLGYHGKLIKLAGGIFHTHHHLADGRQEILTAIAANAGLSTPDLQILFNASTAEAG